MNVQQLGKTVRFTAFYTAGGLGKTGMPTGSTLVVDVTRPDGTVYVSAAAPVEDQDGWYHYDVPANDVNQAGVWTATFKSTDVTCDARHVGDKALVGPVWAENADQPISSRSTLSATGVWAHANRNLTDFGYALPAPMTVPTVAATGGGAVGGLLAPGNYYLKYTQTNAAGETVASPESLQFTVAAGNIPRVTLPALPPGAVAMNIYLTQPGGASGSQTLYKTGVNTTTTDLTAAHTLGQQPPPTVNTTNDLVNDIWTAGARTLTAFNFNVVVGQNNDKSGYALAAAGLDAISVADPGAVAGHTSLAKMIVALYRYFYRKTTATSTQLRTYKDDGTTINVSMALSNDGTTQTKDAAV